MPDDPGRGLWLRTLVFLLVVPCTVLGLVPGWILHTGQGGRVPLGGARWAGLLPLAAGAPLMLRCMADFVARGRGTPAPIDPPRRLVAEGPYRWVRNPMYVAGILIILGEAVLWQAPALLAYAAAFWLATHLCVMGYEEPALARRFGADYARYRREVPRWLPRRPRQDATARPT
ncbi:MAG TPA: isoprenylcysteine carboxylmethyltransferase family protein [Gemmatimonadaceae bacterium]|nr:isoprenylcysteine carboxylmethyltransferase family protein [Gemmatimonadaceae bacterium]